MSTASLAIPLRDRPLWALSWFIWRIIPGRASTKMASFSHTEAGSGLDMLAALERTERRDIRLKYYRHALDELNHSKMFAHRAKVWATEWSRADAVLNDGSWIQSHGINEKQTLFEKLGELEFLAFVWVHETRGAQLFNLYADLMSDDDDTSRMFDQIAKDERFHISYSKAELDRYRAQGRASEVTWALLRVRGRRWWEAWMRFSHHLGTFVSGLWLTIIYVFIVAPFALVAKLTEKQDGGLQPVEVDRSAVERAREMA